MSVARKSAQWGRAAHAARRPTLKITIPSIKKRWMLLVLLLAVHQGSTETAQVQKVETWQAGQTAKMECYYSVAHDEELLSHCH